MDEEPAARFARLLDLPDYDHAYSWLPVDSEKTSSLPSLTTPMSSSTYNEAPINGNRGDLLINLPDHNSDSDSKIDRNFSPPVPDMATLPALEEVAFPIVDIEEVKKPNRPNKPNYSPLLKRSHSIPVSITLPINSSSNSNVIETPQKPLTRLALSKLKHSHSLNRPSPSKRAGVSFEKQSSERHFMTTGDIISLPLCHPVKVENIVESLGLTNAYGSFPEFPDFIAVNTAQNRKSSSVSEENEVYGSSGISVPSTIDEACTRHEVISVSRSQFDVALTSPIIRSRSLTILPNENGQISPDQTSEISPFYHSPMETQVALGGELPVLMTDDAGWVKSSKSAYFFKIIPEYLFTFILTV